MNTGDLPAASGVYLVTCQPTGDTYIGSSRNMRSRQHGHVCAMRSGRRVNSRIKELYAEHGLPSFCFSVVELCDPAVRQQRERYWIDKLHPTLNFFNPCADLIEDDCLRKRAVSLTLDDEYLVRLEVLGERERFKPSLSQLVNDAVRRYVEAEESRPAPSKPPKGAK